MASAVSMAAGELHQSPLQLPLQGQRRRDVGKQYHQKEKEKGRGFKTTCVTSEKVLNTLMK